MIYNLTILRDTLINLKRRKNTMFETIKDMYTYLFELIAKIIEIFGYEYDEEEKKFVEIEK